MASPNPPRDRSTAQPFSRAARTIVVGFVISVPVVCWAIEVGVALTASHLMGGVLIAFAAARAAATRRWPALDWPSIALASFVVIAGITSVRVLLEPPLLSFGESSHAKSLKQFIGLVYAALLFVSFRYVLRTYELGAVAMKTYFWSVAGAAVLTLAQYGIALWNPESTLAVLPVYNSTLGEARALTFSAATYGFPRIALTVVEPSWLATYLLTGTAFWLYSVGVPAGRLFNRTLFVLAGVVLGAAVIVSGSRQAYIIFAALVVGALLVRPARLYRAALVGVSVALGVALIGPAQVGRLAATLLPTADAPVVLAAERTEAPPSTEAPPPVPGATPPHASAGVSPSTILPDALEISLLMRARNADDSVKQRAASVLVGFDVLGRQPWLGVGYGLSDFYMDRLWPRDLGPIVRPTPAPTTMMSGVLAVLTETGVLGGACIVAMLSGIFWNLRRYAARNAESRAAAWGLTAATGAYLIGTLTHSLVVYQMLLPWLLLALASSMPAPEARAVDAA